MTIPCGWGAGGRRTDHRGAIEDNDVRVFFLDKSKYSGKVHHIALALYSPDNICCRLSAALVLPSQLQKKEWHNFQLPFRFLLTLQSIWANIKCDSWTHLSTLKWMANLSQQRSSFYHDKLIKMTCSERPSHIHCVLKSCEQLSCKVKHQSNLSVIL